MTLHESRRVRHDTVFRRVEVREVVELTPHMRRIVVGGPELEGFHSGAPGDHIKMFFPNPDGEFITPKMGEHGPEYPADKAPSPMRDYTPRHHDAAAGTLAIDFVVHGEGPASTWAENASAGDRIAFGGPRGSFVVADDFDHYVLAGDESALPAIARWLEEMPAGRKASVLVEIPEDADRQRLETRADAQVTWLPRNGVPAAQSDLLENALDALAPEGDTFWWVACEARRVRGIRKSIEGGRGVPKEWIRSTGYWKAGADDDGD